MLRNDGIGSTPRLARHTSIGTPPQSGVDRTPNRPPLSRRTPDATDADNDPPFRITATAPAADLSDAPDPDEMREAGQILARHAPSRHGDRRVYAVLRYSGRWPSVVAIHD
ncbi:hypothetical protein ACN27F_02110 [Solwaraspora sp. WMMB335]|uniref:hypothetical protein n=1 Tax=Solwaraspora sp. WMMB335 TaxID=3404118 RepID=UPI003B94AA16